MDEINKSPLELVAHYQKEILDNYNSNPDYLARAQATLDSFKDRHASDPEAAPQLESIRELQPTQVLTVISTIGATEKVKELADKDPDLAQRIVEVCLATDPELDPKDISLGLIDIHRLSSKYLLKQSIALGPELHRVKYAWDETETAKQ